MWGDSNWKLEDLINSAVKYINRRIPLKRCYVRANQVSYMNKTISKAIIVKSRLKNKCMKNMSEKNKINYTRQRNYWVKLFRKEKRNFFANLDTKNITDNKTFWQTVKPLFPQTVEIMMK